MPIYEYRCKSCGHEHDALQKISDAPLTDCPECSEPALKRLISAPSFRLKGSGWYETDFKSDKEKKRNLAESGDKSESKNASGDKASGDKASGDKPKDSGKSESKAPAAKPVKSSKSSGSGDAAA